jgi:hypothetical protein
MEKKYKITVDGREYSVTVEDLSEGEAVLLYPDPGSMPNYHRRGRGRTPVPAPVPATKPLLPRSRCRGRRQPARWAAWSTPSRLSSASGQCRRHGRRRRSHEDEDADDRQDFRQGYEHRVKAGDPVEPGQVLLTIS